MDNRESFTLRPLSIGEIFDRAVTLYVRNFAVFTLIVLTLIAPLTVVQYVALPNQSMSQVIGQMQHPDKQKSPPLSNREIAGYAVVVIFALLLAPLASNAVALGVAQAYRGTAPSYTAAFAKVVRRWPALIGTAIVNLGALVVAYLAFAVIIGVLFGVAIIVGLKVWPLALALGIVGLFVTLGVFVLFMLMVVAYAFSMYSVSLEDAGPFHAFALAYRRVFNRREFKKALLMALAYVVLEIGVLLVSGGVALLIDLSLKSDVVQLAVNAALSAMLSAFLAILIAVYYYDVRTRAEGLDLETDLARLTSVAP